MGNNWKLLWGCLLAACLYFPLYAADTGKTAWEALPRDLQTLLGEYQPEWDKLPVIQQQTLLGNGQHWLARWMNPA